MPDIALNYNYQIIVRNSKIQSTTSNNRSIYQIIRTIKCGVEGENKHVVLLLYGTILLDMQCHRRSRPHDLTMWPFNLQELSLFAHHPRMPELQTAFPYKRVQIQL